MIPELLQIYRDGDHWRLGRNIHAVLLSDGKWYRVEDPTLPNGIQVFDRAYLSFLQGQGSDSDKCMINVPLTEIKGVAYFGFPHEVY